MAKQSNLLLWALLALLAGSTGAHAQAGFDREHALAISQAAIGRDVGEYRFYTSLGNVRSISDYAGKPLVISLIFTSCHHICPATTQNLAEVVAKARAVLGDDSFSVATVGFDTANDTADAMRSFARRQAVGMHDWDFLATDEGTIESLAADLGFQFAPSAAGFDHLIQSSIISAEGVVFRQVYGIDFDTPHLIEPLKVLVFGEDPSASFIDQLTARVKLFCTVYDPASDSYTFDYSIFVGLFMGLTLGVVFVLILLREWRYSRVEAGKVTVIKS